MNQGEIRNEIRNTSANVVGDSIPLPTEDDLAKISKIIKNYRALTRQLTGVDTVLQSRDDAKRNHLIAGNNYDRYAGEYNLVNKGSNMRHIFELPGGLVKAIAKEYPLIFTSKKHFAWFAKHFKELRLTDKY